MGIEIWAEKFFGGNYGFSFLNSELKRFIVDKLGSVEFFELVIANDNLEKEHREVIFKRALKNHYDLETKPGLSAEALYIELLVGKFVCIPGGDYEIGSPDTEIEPPCFIPHGEPRWSAANY